MATWTQADVDALKTVIKSGVQSATFEARGVTYAGLDQLRALLAAMQHDLDAAAGTARYKRLAPKKGLGE